MSNNVKTSTSEAAANCVALPQDYLTKNLVIFYLFFRQWTGSVAMTRADYSDGIKDGTLPPDEVTANYGQKRVIDPKHLRIFETLKKRAETVLNDNGLPFCKGYAIPVDKAQEVADAIRVIAEDYNAKRDEFVRDMPQRCQEWINQNPAFAARMVVPSPVVIAERINADFSLCQFMPVNATIDKTGSLNRTVGGLFEEVLRDISKRSKLLLHRSVVGKQPEDLSQRTLSTLKVMREKLTSLQFLNSGVRPLLELLNRLLAIMPTKGKFSTQQFNILSGALGLMCDESLLNEVATGRLTLDQYISNSFGTTIMPMSNPDPVLLNATPVASQPETASMFVMTPTADEKTEVTAPTNVVAETEATAKVEEVTKEAEKAPEATVLDPTGLDDVDSVLASFFGSPSEEAKVSESEHEESSEEVSTNSVEENMLDEDVPPAPPVIHLSAF